MGGVPEVYNVCRDQVREVHSAWYEDIDLTFGPTVVLAVPQDTVVCVGVAREFEEEVAWVGAENKVLKLSGIKGAQNCGL